MKGYTRKYKERGYAVLVSDVYEEGGERYIKTQSSATCSWSTVRRAIRYVLGYSVDLQLCDYSIIGDKHRTASVYRLWEDV